MIAALSTGLTNAAIGATGFNVKRVHHVEAPLNTGYPYLIIFGITEEPDYDGVTKHEKVRAQFSVRDITFAKVQTAAEALQAVFDLGEGNITVSGWDVIESMRVLGLPPRKFNNVWAWDMDYTFWITKAR